MNLHRKGNFDGKALGNKITWVKSLIRLLKSPANMAGSLKESKTRFSSSNHNELCDSMKLSVQEKLAVKVSNIIDEEIVARVDKLLECKCILNV